MFKTEEDKINMVIFAMLVVTTILLILLISISPADAVSETSTHKKIVTEIANKPDKIKINDKSDNKAKVEIELVSNTYYCSQDCQAILKFKVNKKTDIIDNIYIKKTNDKRAKKEESSKWYSVNPISYGIKYYLYTPLTYTVTQDNGVTETIKLDRWTLLDKDTKLDVGEYYVKIIGSKSKTEKVDWVLETLGLTLDEWEVWGETVVYDEINDSSIDTNLWFTQTTGSGTQTIFENTDYIQVESNSSGLGQTGTALVRSINLPNMASVRNMSMSVSLSSWRFNNIICPDAVGDLTTSNLTMCGTLLLSVSRGYNLADYSTDDSVWTLNMQDYKNPNYIYNVYNDGSFTGTVNCSANTNISLITYVNQFATCGQSYMSSFAQIDYVYYVLNAESTTVTQNSPTDNYIVPSLPITFNCSASSYNSVNVSNISLYIDNTLSHIANFSGNGTFSFQTNLNSTTGSHVWYCTGFDDYFGLTNSSLRTFNISQLVELGHNYTQSVDKPNINEGDIAEFTLSVYMPVYATTSANLWYNGQMYSPDSYSVNGNIVTFIKSLAIPDNSGNSTGKATTWDWNYSIVGIEDNFYTANQTQTVFSIEIDDCSVYTENILNFSYFDEANNTFVDSGLSPMIEVDLVISSLDGASEWTYSNTFNSNNASICVPAYVLNSSDYYLDVIVGFMSDDHVKEFWYLDKGILQENNNSLDSFTTKNVTLRGLLVIDSTTFLFKFYDENYLLQPNAIVTVLRKYIGEGVFKEAERSKQDDNGETHIHLVQEDVIYQFRITLNGTLLYESSEYNAKCLQAPCSITLTQPLGSGTLDNQFDNLAEGTYHISSNKTEKTVTLSFNLQDTGTMTLEVYQYQVDGNVSNVMVGSNSATAKTGTVVVTIPPSYSNTTYYAVVKHNDQWIKSQWVDFSQSGFTYFGVLGLFLAGLIVLTLGFIALSHGGWTILFMLMGLFLAVITKMLDMDWYTYMSITCIGFLIIWKLTQRRSF